MNPANEIGGDVTITERSQLFSITQEEVEKIKSLRIENQVIDDEISCIRHNLMAILINSTLLIDPLMGMDVEY